ncbi:MAG: sodium:solute symporter family protein [Vicinamibacterales bacterium]
MAFTAVDWLVLAAILALPLGVGLYYYRRAGSSVDQFFLSGRDLPWWLAGTSMVATTFAADTPLAVTGIVAAHGIAGNWLWWNAGLGSMLTVFFFARLWRRAGILTDVEFVELRYAGRPAAFLRGFRALYLGLPINCLIIGWVNLAMAKILSVTLGWDRLTAVFVGLAATGCYAALSGLRGIVVADFLQFALAIFGTTVLAYVALSIPAIGGLEGLTNQLPPSTFRLMPSVGVDGSGSDAFALSVTAFIAYLGIQWWASWYPGQEPGGGGYVAQRMMSAKDERHSLLATLWFSVAHYCIRPWPWIIVALTSLVLYPNLADPESGYALVLRDHLPAGMRGLLVGSFFAAYMSTVSTQLNWGTSYLVNDLYARFIRPQAVQRELVRVSRAATVAVMLLSALLTFYLESVRQAWEFALESGAGIGLVLILRWYWWRVSAASEIAALVAAALGFLVIRLFTTIAFPETLLYLVPWTTACWLAVTWLTPAEPMTHLVAFYRRVRPGGPGWRHVRIHAGAPNPERMGGWLLDWAAGCGLVYAGLFGTGSLLFGSVGATTGWFMLAAVAGTWLYRDLTRPGFR